MTPAEHLAEAERLLDQASDPSGQEFIDRDWVLVEKSIAHSLIATAAELGVPHADTTTGRAGATPQPAAS